MNKKVIISLSVIGVVAAAVIGGTVAFFSDTETSTGNTFTAGQLDLQIDNTCHYWQNDVEVDCPWEENSWGPTDLEGEFHKFFSFEDVKPGDRGEDTVSLHVFNNDAWACVTLGPLTNNENGCNEPEAEAENGNCGDVGELGDNLWFTIWADYDCDNELDEEGQEEPVLIQGPANGDPLNGVTWTLADASGNVFDETGPLQAEVEYCLGVAWNVPTDVGNEIQSDIVAGDISFYVEQWRNNSDFFCSSIE